MCVFVVTTTHTSLFESRKIVQSLKSQKASQINVRRNAKSTVQS